jgi:hypothetical protein
MASGDESAVQHVENRISLLDQCRSDFGTVFDLQLVRGFVLELGFELGLELELEEGLICYWW